MTDSRKYSSLGYTAIIGRGQDIKIFYADNSALYSKLVKVKGFADKMNSGKQPTSFEHEFTMTGIRYLTIAVPVVSTCYVCMTYPEDRFLKHSQSEMYKRIYQIKYNSMHSVTAIEQLRKEMAEADVPDSFLISLDRIHEICDDIYFDSTGISRLFDTDHMTDYVFINKMINKSVSCINRYCMDNKRSLLFSVNLSKAVAKLNFTIFEASLYEIVKIAFMVMDDRNAAVVSVNENADGSIGIDYTVDEIADCDSKELDECIRYVKLAYEFLGGKCDFIAEDRSLRFGGSVPASLSNHVNRVKDNIPYESAGEIINGFRSIWESKIGDRPADNSEIIFKKPNTPYEVDVSMLLSSVILGKAA